MRISDVWYAKEKGKGEHKEKRQGMRVQAVCERVIREKQQRE